jgi:CRISPR type III-B/RAMP module-associated protein Cmr5
MQVFNPTKDAIEIYNEVYEKFLKDMINDTKNNPKKTETSLRSRAREMPSLLQDVGLLGVLSFCLGKSEHYEVFINYLEGKEKQKNLYNNTKVGYSIYLYLILKGMEKINLINVKVNDPLNTIIEMSKNLNKVKILEKIIVPYLIEIKRLCEGTLRSG